MYQKDRVGIDVVSAGPTRICPRHDPAPSASLSVLHTQQTRRRTPPNTARCQSGVRADRGTRRRARGPRRVATHPRSHRTIPHRRPVSKERSESIVAFLPTLGAFASLAPTSRGFHGEGLCSRRCAVLAVALASCSRYTEAGLRSICCTAGRGGLASMWSSDVRHRPPALPSFGSDTGRRRGHAGVCRRDRIARRVPDATENRPEAGRGACAPDQCATRMRSL